MVRAGLRSGNAGRGGARTSALVAPGLADQAMTDLRQAAAVGWRNPAAYRYEPALGPLRDREDFKLLMMDLARPGRACPTRSGSIHTARRPSATRGLTASVPCVLSVPRGSRFPDHL